MQAITGLCETETFKCLMGIFDSATVFVEYEPKRSLFIDISRQNKF
jgi:hypothetical protein